MKLLIDEDTQANLISVQLRAAGHDVCAVTEAGLNDDADTVLIDYARQAVRLLLPKDCNDFTAMISRICTIKDRRMPEYWLSINIYYAHLEISIYRDRHSPISRCGQYNNPQKDMSYAAIVRALANLESSGWDFRGEFIKVNDWNY